VIVTGDSALVCLGIPKIFFNVFRIGSDWFPRGFWILGKIHLAAFFLQPTTRNEAWKFFFSGEILERSFFET
jgi:hypothetical protein